MTDSNVVELYNNVQDMISKVKLYNANIKTLPKDRLVSTTTRSNNNDLDSFRSEVLKLLDSYKVLVLSEAEEVKSQRSNTMYVTVVADSGVKIKLFVLYLLVYSLEAATRKYRQTGPPTSMLANKPHVALDYEFNRQKIALMQINFETAADTNKTSNSYIWLVNPAEMNKHDTDVMIDFMMTNQNIYKILHGADSLDIPYMYYTLFDGDKDVIKAFTRKVIDTRFLCEYHKLSLGPDKTCNIYEALRYFGTITEKKFNDLKLNHKNMGPVQHVVWDVHKLSKNRLQYALYDVLYLQHLVLDIYIKVKKKTPELVFTFRFVNPVVRFVYLERNGVTDVSSRIKSEVDVMNNFRLVVGDNKEDTTMIDLFNKTIAGCKIKFGDDYVDLDTLMSIGYLKKTILPLFKNVVYYTTINKFEVYSAKNKRYTGSISLDEMYDRLRKDGYVQLYELLLRFHDEVSRRLL